MTYVSRTCFCIHVGAFSDAFSTTSIVNLEQTDWYAVTHWAYCEIQLKHHITTKTLCYPTDAQIYNS